MRGIIVTIIASALLTNCARAQDAVSAHAIVKAFADRDLKAIQRCRPQVVEGLPLKERNQIALAAARSLSIEQYIDVLGKASLHQYFTKPPAQDSQEEAECRRQWGINMSAAELLRHLSEKRMVNDPAVLPYLIHGLDHPDRSFVGQKCFHALKYLTRQTAGEIYWARLVEDKKRHGEIREWWLDWLDQNKERHPVFDGELEEKARSEVLRLSGLIEKELKPRFPELSLFQSPQTLPLRWQNPLFYVEYNPGSWSLAINSFRNLDRNLLPWILIRCHFQSNEQLDTWVQEVKLQPPENLQNSITRCYAGSIQGSDLLVEVLAASRNETLVKQMRSVLSGRADTQPPTGGDGKPAPQP